MPTTPFAPAPAHPDSQFLVALSASRGETAAAVVLLASDGTARSDGAARVAAARADAMGATLEIVTVLAVEAPAAGLLDFDETKGLRRSNELRGRVEAQIERALGRYRAVSITVLRGNPAFAIARLAIERRAALLVVGLGRHRVADRIFSDETALLLARIARVPVLAVPAECVTVPRCAVVAIDFSDISLRAAQAAVEAVDERDIVVLAHVMPPMYAGSANAASDRAYEAWAASGMAALRAKLVVPAGIEVRTITLNGWPAPTLLEHASAIGADLLVTGTHGRGFVARTIVGSVTTQLLRGAVCPVLTVPRDPLPTLAAAMLRRGAPEPFDAPLAWRAQLDDFTRRNTGRRIIVEVDDLARAAQSQDYDYPFLAAFYSDTLERVELMLGDHLTDGQRHTRSIGGVKSIEVLTDGEGHDVALRVQHASSQTLLSFVG
jgi:nucleotide-binding universal stress UspA family protein